MQSTNPLPFVLTNITCLEVESKIAKLIDFSNLKNLDTLHLEKTFRGRADLENLLTMNFQECKSLKTLILGIECKEFNQLLPKLTKLENLQVAIECEFDDFELSSSIKELINLKQLKFSNNFLLSEDQKLRLLSLLPNCQIIYP